ncbi:MAG: HEAT repeat domain-containing protein [Planctomycetota bacterium]|nr:HEAT repeat domain-containing protein [Planctomycetota bacterium]
MDWLTVPGVGSSRPVELPGREESTYTAEGPEGGLLKISRSYQATSAAQVDGKPQIGISGEGKLTFDLARGVFASSQMKVRVAIHEGTVRVEVPVQVSYDVLSEAEEAKIKADGEKLAKDSAEMVKEMNRPVTLAELPELIKDLQSDDSRKATVARTRLKGKPGTDSPRQLAPALEKYVQHENEKVREAVGDALAHHATKENVPALLKLLDSDSVLVRQHAVSALGRLQATAAIDRLVQLLLKGDPTVVSALGQMGSAAEPAMLKVLAQGDRAARDRALLVLTQIGTKKSLPALEKLKNDGDPLTKLRIEPVIRSIQLRQ